MAKKQIKNYVFIPGAAGVGKLKVLDKIDQSSILLITNTTDNVNLYNFGDPEKQVTVTFQRTNDGADPDFPYASSTSEGVTHIFFQSDTSSMDASDEIQIFVEAEETFFRPYKFGTDAIERMRVATPQSMIDADFEYGLQPTKWQTIDIARGYPSIYEIPGSETQVYDIETDASSGTSGVGDSQITVTTVSSHGLSVNDPVRVAGTDDSIPGGARANGSFVVATVPSTTTFTYYSKGKVGTATTSIKTSYTSLKLGSYYTGADIGSPTFTVETQGSSGSVVTEHVTASGSNRLAYDDANTDEVVVGSPLSGSGLASGTQVTGIATVSAGTAKTVYSDVSSPQNSVILQDTTGLQVGCAVSTGAASNAESVFITNINENTITLSGSFQTNYKGSHTELGDFSANNQLSNQFGNGSGALFDVSRDSGRYRVSLGNIVTSGTGVSAGSTVSVGSTQNIVVGQTVSGTGIGAGATVTAINADYIGLSTTNTGAVSGNLTLTNIGTGYAVNDRIRINSQALGATTTDSELVVRVNGVNGSGGITSITSAKEPSAQATSAKISTAVSRQDGGSLLLNGTDSYVNFAADDEFNFGSNDFTVDFQLYRNRLGVNEVLWDMRTGSANDGALSVAIDTNNQVNLQYAGSNVISGITTTSSAEWTHIAVSKSGTTTKLFVGGIEQGTYTDNNTYGARPVRLGSAYNGTDFTSANYDTFRVSKGVCRFSAAYQPPQTITNDVYNSLLMRFRGINNSVIFSDDSKGTALLSSAVYNGIQGTASASGLGANFTVERTGGSSSAYLVTLTSSGTGYIAGETIVVDGSLLGGASSVNNLTITVSTVDAQGAILTSSAAGTAASGDVSVSSVGDHNSGAYNSGSGASITVSRNGSSYSATVSGGTGYYPEYQIKILGSVLGGVDVTNDLTVTTDNITQMDSYFGRVISGSASGTPVSADSIEFFPALTLSEPTTASIPDATSLTFSSIASIGCTFTSNHGLVPGSPIFVNVDSSGTNHGLVGGPRIIEGIPELNKITFNARAAGTIAGNITGKVYTRPDCFYIHRPFDGGVLVGTGGPTHGAHAIRQSKKYLRYQSGKGIMFTTGTLLAPSYDVRQLTSTGTAVGSIISITTDDVEHGLQAGAEVQIKGVTTTGYNGHYTIASITNEYTFTVLATSTLGATNAVLGDQPQVSLYNWKGSTVRAGAFDEQNGIFWQYDGINLSVGLRSSTYQLAGTIAVDTDSNTVTGTNTRFREQLIAGNKIVIRGMTHTVTHIENNTTLTVTPDFRGVSNVTGVKAVLVKEILIPQSQWNLDRGDGTGPSGYKIEINKMQMYGFQYSWYGAGFIDWMLRGPNGDYLYVHRLKNNNRNTEAFMRSGNLPVRYEVINEGAKTKLTEPVTSSSTDLSIDDVTLLPSAGSLYIDNEIINYTGVTTSTNTLTGITRAGTYNNFYSGSTRTYSAGVATDHSSGTGVVLLSNTATPIISHWGSAYLTDGLFDTDRGYIFNYQATGFDISITKQTAFLIRLSPSVSNAILGDLGERELINRAQLLLKGLEFTATGGSATQGVVIEGVLNPQNYPTNPDDVDWFALNNVAVGGQPSFAQIADGTQVTWPGATTSYNYTNSIASSKKDSWVALLASEVANLRVGMQVTANGLAGGTTIRRIESWTFQSNGQTHKYIRLTNRINVGSVGNTQFTFTTIDNRAIPGETIFSFVGSGGGGNATKLDLSDLKELNNTPIGGRGAFPNGPDVLAINVYTTGGSDFTGNLVLRWSEAQA